MRARDADVTAEWIRGAFGWIVILWAAVLIVPILIVAAVGFAQGTIPTSEAGGIFGVGPGYPVFTPPLWLSALPALGALALALATWRYPGQFMDSIFSARWDLGIMSFVGAVTTVAASVMFGAPFIGILLAVAGIWFLALLTVLSRGVWDAVVDAAQAMRPQRQDPDARRTGSQRETAARTPVPALRITADAARWQRAKQRLTLHDDDPRRLTVEVFDSATNELGLARALVRAIEGDDAAPPVSTSVAAGPGTAVRTVRSVRSRGATRIIATWHWDDGTRAILMAAYDVDPDRFEVAEADLDALAGAIRIGSL